MFRSLIDTLKSKPKNKFSLENLQYLYNQLVRNPIITEQNKNLIIETLRQLAELIIWGDQHNSDFFDFFLEKNLVDYFLRILSQKTSRDVKIQLIQTLSILIENIRNQNSIYYLLSNNHINELITHKFDFSDDELLAYYISLLKTLSLKLNQSSLQFFFNESASDFPLYTEAIKFFNHKESMIRIAVRTLTLNVYKVEDESMRRFILDKTAAPYFSNIVWYIREQCTTLDTLVITSTHANKIKLEDFAAELLDFFYYLHDIFNLGISALSEVLSAHLLEYLLLPQFVKSLIADDDCDLEDRLSPLLAVFLITQVFYIFSYKPLINTLAAAIIHPNPASYSSSPTRAIALGAPVVKRIKSSPNIPLEISKAIKKSKATNPSTQPSSQPTTKRYASNRYYEAILSLLESDDRMALGVLCLLNTILKSPSIDNILLEISGLFPYRLYKAKCLLEALISSSPDYQPSKTDSLLGSSSDTDSSNSDNHHHHAVTGKDGEKEVKKSKGTNNRGGSGGGVTRFEPRHHRSISDGFVDLRGSFSSSSSDPFQSSPSSTSSSTLTIHAVTSSPLMIEEIPHHPPLPSSSHPPESKESSTHEDALQPPSSNEDIELNNSTVTTTATDNTTTNNTTIVDNTLDSKEDHVNVESITAGIDHQPPSSLSPSSSSIPSQPIEQQEKTSTESTTESVDPEVSSTAVLHNKGIQQQQQQVQVQVVQQVHASNNEVSPRGDSSSVVLVEHLLLFLLRSGNHCRLITLQMATLLIKELVYIQDTPPNLKADHLKIMEDAYHNSIKSLEEYISGNLGNIFLELFESQLKTYRQINFDSLIMDCSSFLLPVSSTPMSGISLSKRLPSGEAERIENAIQVFLVLREFKYTMLNRKDDSLPLREEAMPFIKPKDLISLDDKSYTAVWMLIGPTKKKLRRYLYVGGPVLVIAEPDPRTVNATNLSPGGSRSPQSSPTKGNSAIVCNVIPFQSIEIEADPNDDCTLILVCHILTWSGCVIFDDPEERKLTQELLEKEKHRVRGHKMQQIHNLLS